MHCNYVFHLWKSWIKLSRRSLKYFQIWSSVPRPTAFTRIFIDLFCTRSIKQVREAEKTFMPIITVWKCNLRYRSGLFEVKQGRAKKKRKEERTFLRLFVVATTIPWTDGSPIIWCCSTSALFLSYGITAARQQKGPYQNWTRAFYGKLL